MKRGRKPANGVDAKSFHYSQRMTPQEYENLSQMAQSKGVNMSDIVNTALELYYIEEGGTEGES